MLFGTSKRIANVPRALELLYQGQEICNTLSYKYLGCLLDQNLTMNDFFNTLYKNASRRIRLLTRVRPFLTSHATTGIYSMMILSVLTYNSLVDLHMSEIHVAKLKSIENRSRHIINQSRKFTVAIQSTENIINKNACKTVRKCLEKTVCENLHNYF